jgi:hypothetical protein
MAKRTRRSAPTKKTAEFLAAALRDIQNEHPTHVGGRPDEQFAYWAAKQLLVSPEEVNLCTVGGPSDKGIDIIHCDHRRKRVSIAQVKYHASAINEPRDSVLGLVEKVRNLYAPDGDKELQHFLTGLTEPVKQPFLDARDLCIKQGYGLDLYYITLGLVDKDLHDHLLDQVNTAASHAAALPRLEIIDYEAVKLLHDEYESGVDQVVPHHTLQVTKVLECTTAPLGLWVILTTGGEIGNLFRRYQWRIFQKNIRGYLGQDKSVNQAITKTLDDYPDQFVYLNNGITILCHQAEEKGSKGKHELYLQRPQIVNGQQTTRVLHSHANALKASVLVRVIVADTDVAALTSKIVTGTNAQNPVTLADLKTNDQIQIRLARALKHRGYFYMRRREPKEEFYVRFGRPKAYRIIRKAELAQVVVACKSDPHSARVGSDKLFADDRYSAVFEHWDELDYLCMYWCFYVSRIACKKNSDCKWFVTRIVWDAVSRNLLADTERKERFVKVSETCVESATSNAKKLTAFGILGIVANTALGFVSGYYKDSRKRAEKPDKFFKGPNGQISSAAYRAYAQAHQKQLGDLFEAVASYCD